MRIPSFRPLTSALTALALFGASIATTPASAAHTWWPRGHAGHVAAARGGRVGGYAFHRSGGWGGGYAWRGHGRGYGVGPGLVFGLATGAIIAGASGAYDYPYGGSPCWSWHPIFNRWGHVIGHHWIYVCG